MDLQSPNPRRIPLADAVQLTAGKLIHADRLPEPSTRPEDAAPMLIVLAAGKGTRFGTDPKCIQPVSGVPLARHSINAFQRCFGGPVIGLVHYRHHDVMAALGDDMVYIHSDNPTGGTAYAAYETFSIPWLATRDPLLILTMGDRIVPESIFKRLLHIHGQDDASVPRLTLLTAEYEPPRHLGKGRMVRDKQGHILQIIEQRDIDALSDPVQQRILLETTEGNCPLYVIRASWLERYLRDLTPDNAQQQYYITDMVRAIVGDGGEIRSLTMRPSDPAYDLVNCDVTRPRDLALLEGVLNAARALHSDADNEIERAAERLRCDRPAGQVASIAAQLRELLEMAERDGLGFESDRPLSVGISGGRLRIAFMHPDMGRFYGPAWQMPTGAATAAGREQIVVMIQEADDGAIHLYPTDAEFRETLNALPADDAAMYPGDDIRDWYSYEGFGTRMAERLLLSLGYFSDTEIQARRDQNLPLPPSSLWVSNGMRRPFSLIGNAIASIRTLRDGTRGKKVQACLGRQTFRGLRLASTGNIPRGGFSSSSAVTVAVKNAVNALYDLQIPPDLLVHLACQAEYGTGVRAGSLDQATEQKGKAGQGALISSNPNDNYRLLGTYPAPTDRFRVIYPYTIDRDREAWKWSAGFFGESAADPLPTTGEIRKLTGKAAEIAAILTRLPLEEDFFPHIESDLMRTGYAGAEATRWVANILRQLPLRIARESLWKQCRERRAWLAEQYRATRNISEAQAIAYADATLNALMDGWRDPVLRRTGDDGSVALEIGVPLRAMVAYLFGEVAKNFHLIRHPETWIETVTRSQDGDRCFNIDPQALPDMDAMLGQTDWETGTEGPERMQQWLQHAGATPVNFNRDLDDASLSQDPPLTLHRLDGGNFFRGLALIDLAEAMLKRAFGADAIAVRVNAAGQGDYFQLHIDTHKVAVDTVQSFFSRAFYRRFGLHPHPEFIQPHPGGGAAGIRLSRFDRLPELIHALETTPARH